MFVDRYESEIGRFDGATRCPTRHFAEFPTVADKMIEDHNLREKTVLMYCTGGIRCERASAYLRSMGVERCFQLSGGIARYCEHQKRWQAEAEGQGSQGCRVPSSARSLFRGRNFVFDRRMSIAGSGGVAEVGRCAVCLSAWESYDRSFSCRECSALVLVCAGCRPQYRSGSKKSVCAELTCTYCDASK